MKRKFVEIGKGLGGINNYRPIEELEAKYIAGAVNFDIDDAGLLRSRKGYKLIYNGNCHSLFSHNETTYFREADTLKSITKSPSTSSGCSTSSGSWVVATLETGPKMSGRQRMWYVAVNDCIYYSDGVVAGCIQNGQTRQWGIMPPPLPDVQSASSGSLKRGIYLVGLTYQRSDGYESGCAGAVEIETSGGFYVNYDASDNASVVAVNIYVSMRGADVLYLAYSADNVSGSYFYDGTGMPLSYQLNTMFEQPPVAGQLIEYFYGHMIVAKDNCLFFSEPYRYESFRYDSNFMVFENRVTLLAAVKDGLFVGTERDIYFLQGTNPLQLVRYNVAGYGAVYGSQYRGKPYADVVCFESERGLCRITTGGQFENMTDGVVYFDAGEIGAGYFREYNGIEQFIVTLGQIIKTGEWDAYEQRIDVELVLPSLR